jgi:hypothetical protein
MTASQSRFGGLAEVGRAPTKEPRKDNSRYGGFVASAGLIGSGRAISNQGSKFDAKAKQSLSLVETKNRQREKNVNSLRALQEHKRPHVKNNERFARWVRSPQSNGSRYFAPGYNTLSIPKGSSNEVISPVGAELANRVRGFQNKQKTYSKVNRRLLDEVRTHSAIAQSASRNASRVRVGGKAAGVLGLAGIIGSLYANEARRGTIGQRRSNTPRPVSMAEARYRRVNGM